MKVFTFYSNRFDSATTSIALRDNGIEHNVLVHTDDQADNFRKHKTAVGNIVVTGNQRGLAYQRNSALDMMDKGEWAAFLCDDFKKIKSYPKEFIMSKTLRIPVTYANQQAYNLTKRPEMPLKEMFSMFPKLIEIAEKNNIHLIGFALHDNPLNLQRKFTTRGLADGRFWLVKKSNMRFDEKAQLIDDVAWTAENLIRFNNVLVLNWTIPYFKRYTAGGFGSQEERIVQRKSECDYLLKKYHPLVKSAKKPGWPDGTHIFLNGSDKAIEIVRKRLGVLK